MIFTLESGNTSCIGATICHSQGSATKKLFVMLLGLEPATCDPNALNVICTQIMRQYDSLNLLPQAFKVFSTFSGRLVPVGCSNTVRSLIGPQNLPQILSWRKHEVDNILMSNLQVSEIRQKRYGFDYQIIAKSFIDVSHLSNNIKIVLQLSETAAPYPHLKCELHGRTSHQAVSSTIHEYLDYLWGGFEHRALILFFPRVQYDSVIQSTPTDV